MRRRMFARLASFFVVVFSVWSLLSWFRPAGRVRFIACETERGKVGGGARAGRNSIGWAGCEVLAWGTGFPDAWRSEW